MGTSERASVSYRLDLHQTSVNPFPNRIVSGGYNFDKAYPNGDADDKIKVIGGARVSIPASSTVNFDLTTDLEDLNHDPVTTLAEIRHIMIVAAKTNDAAITLGKGAANGNPCLGDGNLPLAAEDFIVRNSRANDTIPVTAGSKVIDLVNPSAAQANVVRIYVIGTE